MNYLVARMDLNSVVWKVESLAFEEVVLLDEEKEF